MTRTALKPYLGSWMKLNALFQSDSYTREDLLTLLDLERKGESREYIIKRLTGRLATVETKLRREGKL
jgi:hypothetical protein